MYRNRYLLRISVGFVMGLPAILIHSRGKCWLWTIHGKCCPIVSCLDRPSRLRHSFSGEKPSNNTKPTNINQKSHANQLISGKCCSLPVDLLLSHSPAQSIGMKVYQWYTVQKPCIQHPHKSRLHGHLGFLQMPTVQACILLKSSISGWYKTHACTVSFCKNPRHLWLRPWVPGNNHTCAFICMP